MRVVMFAGTMGLVGCASPEPATHDDSFHTAFAGMPYPPPARSWHPRNPIVGKPPAVPDATPVVVNGLSGDAVVALLGQPAARTGPAPGETWTYHSGTCEVELFLFPDVTHGGLHVLDYRISGAGSGDDGEQACLRRLRNDQTS